MKRAKMYRVLLMSLLALTMLVSTACSSCIIWVADLAKSDDHSKLELAVDGSSAEAGSSPSSLPSSNSHPAHQEQKLPEIQKRPSDEQMAHARSSVLKDLLKAQVHGYCLNRDAAAERELIKRCFDYRDYFVHASTLTKVDPSLLAAVSMTESRCGQYRRSFRSALGLMQVLKPPEEAVRRAREALGTEIVDWEHNDYHNVVVGGFTIKVYQEWAKGDIVGALLAYHNGPNAKRLNSDESGWASPLAEFQARVAFEPCPKSESQAECDHRRLGIIGYPLEVLSHGSTLKRYAKRFNDTVEMTADEEAAYRKSIDVKPCRTISPADELIFGINVEVETSIVKSEWLPPPPPTPQECGRVPFPKRQFSLERVAELFRTKVKNLVEINGAGMSERRLRSASIVIVPGVTFRLRYSLDEIATKSYPDYPKTLAKETFVELNRGSLDHNETVFRPCVRGFVEPQAASAEEVVKKSIRRTTEVVRKTKSENRRSQDPEWVPWSPTK